MVLILINNSLSALPGRRLLFNPNIMEFEQLSIETENLRNEVLERRDNIMRTMGIQKDFPFLKEQNDQLNELAQLVTYTRSGIDEPFLNKDVEERLHALRFGLEHPNRIDR